MNICLHCDEPAIAPLYEKSDLQCEKPFCCEGCLTVYQVIQNKGLGEYYSIKSDAATFKRRAPVQTSASSFSYLNDQEFLIEYSWSMDSTHVMEFYLEGIHCLACLWLIEKLPEFVPGVRTSKLDLDRSVVTVVVDQGYSFSQAATELSKLGYKPHPIRKNQATNEFKKKEERSWLIRMGIAGAASGNIMLYAVSNYGGASGGYAELFNTISVAFAAPVFLYSAYPFYQNAWHAIKNKTLSIDIPISMSLIVGAFMGVYNLMIGVPDNYFDSLSALVFLLLLSRYFLHKIQERGLDASDLHFFYQSDSVLIQDKKCADGYREIHPRFIKKDDVIKVRALEIIPGDGEILEGQSHVNNSLLTGESLPFKVKAGDKVFSGTQNLDQELLIAITKPLDESRLGQILKNVENGWSHKSEIIKLTNRISKYFTFTVIALSVLLFVYLLQTHSLRYALEGAITLMIVTCPCALALAVPLTFTRSLSKASQAGIIIKSDEIIERLAKIRTIYLDKTGTITFGKIKVVKFEQAAPSAYQLHDVVYALEKKSRHPVGASLFEYSRGHHEFDLPVFEFKEILGKGVSGKIGSYHYEINNKGIFENQRLVGVFEVADTIRTDSKSALKRLMLSDYHVHMLSGDRKEVAMDIARKVQLDGSFVHSELSPEEKSSIIRLSKNSMMVGDGANDAIALSEASVGVAVMGAMDISLRAADVYLSTPGLVPVVELLTLSRETMKVIERNLVLSLLYNSTSVVLAFCGLISPLTAAIIMPLSSLTVLISTLTGTKKLRMLWKY
jgi:heavy metal-(Cd/Co/Hg/Pb/Zn)-translocating P-type ATPase